jgi:hypothetical protein
MTVPCTTNVEALDCILGTLDTHKFVFTQLMGLANALPILSLLSLLVGGSQNLITE